MLIIPAIDLKDGQCVRLRQGRMEDSTVFSDDPVEMARHWLDKGARRLHLVDLNGAFAGEPVNGEIVQAIAKAYPQLPIQIGGGIRNEEIIESYLDAGVQYVIIGTKAVKEPGFIRQVCKKYPGHIIVGLDAKNGKVATDGWADISEINATDLAKGFVDDGVTAIVYTDIDRDGMMQGVNVEATVKMAQQGIDIIASGGITNMDDIKALCKANKQCGEDIADNDSGGSRVVGNGIIGAITGRAIYEGTLDIERAQDLCDNGWD